MRDKYFVDYPKLLGLHIDYAEDFSLSLKRTDDKYVPVMSYHGEDKRAGENVIRNLEKMISVQPDKDNGLDLFIGKERFARFVRNPADEQISLDTNVPQKHLTSFEMRMLARSDRQNVFARDEIEGFSHSTDLHTHFAGCLSPEDLVEVGLEHHNSIPASLAKKGRN